MKHVVKTIIIFLGLVVGEPVSYVDVVAPKSDVLLSFRPALGDVQFNTPRQTFLEVVIFVEQRRSNALLRAGPPAEGLGNIPARCLSQVDLCLVRCVRMSNVFICVSRGVGGCPQEGYAPASSRIRSPTNAFASPKSIRVLFR